MCHGDVWEVNIPGSENIVCKGPGAALSLACRKNEAASVAGAE